MSVLEQTGKDSSKVPERERLSRVSVIAFFSDDLERVLLFRYGPDSRIAQGTYGLPAGRLEDGETELQVATREFHEETGLTVQDSDLIAPPGNQYYGELVQKDGKKQPSKWTLFVAKAASGKIRGENGEGKPEWVDVSKIGDLSPLLLNCRDLVLSARDFSLKQRS